MCESSQLGLPAAKLGTSSMPLATFAEDDSHRQWQEQLLQLVGWLLPHARCVRAHVMHYTFDVHIRAWCASFTCTSPASMTYMHDKRFSCVQGHRGGAGAMGQ